MDDRRRCAAHVSDGSRRCRKAAILGGTVCATHGGAAPQVRRSARERLLLMVDPALDGLQKALDSGDLHAVCRASVAVLDRAGYPRTTRHEVEQVTLEQGRMLVDVLERALAALGVDINAARVRHAVGQAIREQLNGDGMSSRRNQHPEPEPLEVAL